MVVVAVAGGTSPTLGKSIVTAILATGKHEVIILSRKPENHDSSLPSHKYGAPIAYVAYESVETLTTALKSVHTVLSCVKITNPDLMESCHLNLLHASLAAGSVRRFSPCDFSMGPKTHKTVDLLAHKSTLLKSCQDLAAEKSSSIEIAQFQNGMFMQYLAQNLPDPDGPFGSAGTRKEVLLSGLEDDLMLGYIDIASGRLPIPTTASGTPARITTTSIADIGRFVAAALGLPPGSWSGCMGMAGATITFAEVRDILARETNAPKIKDETITAEECGEAEKKFNRQLERGFSVEALKGKMVAQMEKSSCGGVVGEGVIEGKLNELCPDVEVTDLRTYLREVWGEKDPDLISRAFAAGN